MFGVLYNPPAPKKRADKATWDAEIRPLLDRLEAHHDVVADAALATVRRVLPSYNDVSDGALRASALRNSRSAAKTLSGRRLPSDRDLWDMAVAAGERARQGLPVQDILAAYGISLHQIREFLAEAAADSTPAVTLEMVQLLWALADAVGLRLAMVHREAEVELARHDERQRADFLRGLVFGSLGPSEVRRLGPAYQLGPDLRYVALRGRPRPGTTTAELQRAISASARDTGHAAFVDVLDGDVVGVALRPPQLGACAATVGVGPAVDLTALEPSFATASRVLEVAERFGHQGVFRLEDLSLRVAVAAEDELGELLVRRYLEPLSQAGGRGEAIRETVAAFVEHRLNIKATALALHIHENTVRYRLDRFEELVGARLEDLPAAFEVWWALQRSALTEHAPGPAQARR